MKFLSNCTFQNDINARQICEYMFVDAIFTNKSSYVGICLHNDFKCVIIFVQSSIYISNKWWFISFMKLLDRNNAISTHRGIRFGHMNDQMCYYNAFNLQLDWNLDQHHWCLVLNAFKGVLVRMIFIDLRMRWVNKHPLYCDVCYYVLCTARNTITY